MTSLHAVLRDIKKLTDVAVELINKGADVNAQDAEGETPLKLAIRTDNAKIVKCLIKKGADVNAVDKFGGTPMHAAAVFTKNVYIFKLLNDAGADIDAKIIGTGQTSLMYSAFFRNIEACKFLIGAGASVKEKNSTVLHELFDYQGRAVDVNILKCLIEAGAGINARNYQGETPLHRAFFFKNLTVSKILIEAGADINARTSDGRTPMSYYFSLFTPTPAAVDDVQFFLKVGFKPDDVFGTALTYLIGYENKKNVYSLSRDLIEENQMKKTIQLLIAYSNINCVDVGGKSILVEILEYYSRSSKKKSFYTIFLQHIAKINVLKLPIYLRLLATIEAHDDYKNYFKECVQELEKAKKSLCTRIDGCWVTYFNLLVEDEAKLVKYAGNENLVADLKKRAWNSFPIYGTEMQDKMAEAIGRRKLFNEAANTLSSCCPIFGPCHLVIRDVLDTFDEEDWEKLSGKYL